MLIALVVWINRGGEMYGPFLTVDCAQRIHYDHRIDQGDVVEVSNKQAKQWGMKGPEDVFVWFVKPPPIRWH